MIDKQKIINRMIKKVGNKSIAKFNVDKVNKLDAEHKAHLMKFPKYYKKIVLARIESKRQKIIEKSIVHQLFIALNSLTTKKVYKKLTSGLVVVMTLRLVIGSIWYIIKRIIKRTVWLITLGYYG